MADSKLCTTYNLCFFARYGGKFVSVLPQTWRDHKTFRKKLHQIKVRWYHILTIPSKICQENPPNIFYTSSESPSRTKEEYRIVWIKNSQKSLLDKETRLQSIKKAEIDLTQLPDKLNYLNQKNRSAISKAYQAIL